jgi:hypothetical protein
MNGTLAIVTSITLTNDKIVTSITIKIININIQIMLKRQTLQHKYTSETYYNHHFNCISICNN